MSSFGQTGFKLGFEISPIILTDGIASQVPGQMLPIVGITEASNFIGGLLTGSINLDLDNFFAHFKPVPGSQLINNEVGEYPYANQTVAANAIVSQPLTTSMLMYCPVNKQGGYVTKFLTMSALKKALDLHTAQGGTYTVVTPSYNYTNCLLTSLRDVTSGETKQAQQVWQWDFRQPLVATNDADNVMNSLMAKIGGGLPILGNPSWSGPAATIGSPLTGITGATGASAGFTGTMASGVSQLMPGPGN